MKIIAESASNHQGDYEYLKKLAIAAKEAGADYFTVQILQIDSFCDVTYTNRSIVDDVVFDFEQWRDFFIFCKAIDKKLLSKKNTHLNMIILYINN